MANKKEKTKKVSKNFCKENYSLSWKYIKESKNYILFIIGVFLVSALIAVFYQPPEVVKMIQEFIQQLVNKTENLNSWQMIFFIFNNNFQSSFFSMILGLFLGVFPFLAAFSNGYVLGFVSEKVVVAEGISSLWRLMPHGIFEFPAIILSLALGVKFGMFLFSKKSKKEEFIRRLRNSLRVFLFVVLPLLIVAAIIEGILVVMLR